MRFSAEHAPAVPRRRFWIWMGAVFLTLLLPVIAVNLAVDPFDFRIAPHLSLIRENITRKDDTMLWAAGEFRRLPRAALDKVTIAVVGDSRTDTMCRWPNSPRIFKLGSDYVINLSVGGATLIESVKVLDSMLPRLPKLRVVVFSAPIERVGTGEMDRAANALHLADWPALYAFSLGTLSSSLGMLSEQDDGKKKGWQPSERPDIDPQHLPNTGEAGLDIAGAMAKGGLSVPLPKAERKAAAAWQNNILRLDEDRLMKRTRELIGPMAAKLRDRHIELVFFFPPLHPAVSGGIENEITSLKKTFVEELKTMGEVEDFSLSVPAGLKPIFADALHLQQDVAHAMMAELYLRKLAISKPKK